MIAISQLQNVLLFTATTIRMLHSIKAKRRNRDAYLYDIQKQCPRDINSHFIWYGIFLYHQFTLREIQTRTKSCVL